MDKPSGVTLFEPWSYVNIDRLYLLVELLKKPERKKIPCSPSFSLYEEILKSLPEEVIILLSSILTPLLVITLPVPELNLAT